MVTQRQGYNAVINSPLMQLNQITVKPNKKYLCYSREDYTGNWYLIGTCDKYPKQYLSLDDKSYYRKQYLQYIIYL